MPATVRSRRLAGGFLGMVALVVTVEAVVGTRNDLVDPVAMQWRYRAKAVRGRAARAEILCLGDSQVRFGVAAGVLQERSGRGVSNQAVLAAPAAATYFALRDAYGAGARPRLVVVGFAPFLLLPGYRLNRAFLPEASDLSSCLDLARAGADPELAGALTLGWIAPTVRARSGLRDRVARRLLGPPRAPIRTRRPDLWLPGDNEAVFDWFYHPAWAPGAEHEGYVDRFLDLASDRGAAVVWLMPPVAATIRREWDALGLSARYTRFAASIQARHPGLVVVDARGLAVAAADLLDPLHLNPSGASALTARLAPILDRLADGPRWVDLAEANARVALDRP